MKCAHNQQSKQYKFKLALFTIFIVTISNIKCDLPVHCLKSQIEGDWLIHATKTYPQKKDDLYNLGCSHTIPSNENNAYKASINPKNFVKTFRVKLKDNDKAILITDKNNIGTWTMVYDEGFDIRVEDYSFFAFSKYSPKRNFSSGSRSGNFVSMCYSTLIGWYHKGNHWGCFYAEKQHVNPNQITNDDVTNKLLVVEGTVQSKSGSEPGVDQKEPDLMRFREKDLDVYTDNDGIYFLENSLKSSYKNHEKTVARINSSQKLWTAENYQEFSKMSLKELNKYAGRKKHFKVKKLANNLIHNSKYIGKNFFFNKWVKPVNHPQIKELRSNIPNQDQYPQDFLKWVPYMSEPRNQGTCGSCYAVATLNMLEARLRIKHNINEKLSLDHVLNCAVYNQGCDGGYSYLVLKFANEIELIPERCQNYQDNKFTCMKKCPNDETSPERIYKVKDYGYLGGSYGKCNEQLLMKELIENGPIVVSFEPDYHFMLYKKGIYKSLSHEYDWVKNKLPKPEWEKVDHSVTLVGWGIDQESQEKYWLLMNSWGKNWGENGYFKMVRGIDHMGIESICEVGSMYYVDI